MKKRIIRKIDYIGSTNNSGTFIISYQIHIMTTLKKRGMLTQRQCEKGISLLKEHSC